VCGWFLAQGLPATSIRSRQKVRVGRLDVAITGRPLRENLKTSVLTALSVLRAI
jgi:predicted dinucleotide-utilizing enzyme